MVNRKDLSPRLRELGSSAGASTPALFKKGGTKVGLHCIGETPCFHVGHFQRRRRFSQATGLFYFFQ